MKLRNMTSVYIFYYDMVLLIKKESSPLFDKPFIWCGIGGHFEKEELNDPAGCCLRELYEEANIRETNIENFALKYMTIRRKEDEIRQQYIFFAELKKDHGPPPSPQCGEGEMAWIGTDVIFNLPMSVTNEKCLKHYFERGKYNDNIYCAVMGLKNGVPSATFTALDNF